MSLAHVVTQQLERASWIRRMFEEGARLKAERGADSVFDFTLGNPIIDPPPQVLEALRRVATSHRCHAYMPNAGFPETREAVAQYLNQRTGVGYTARHIFMTVGSAGAINTYLRAILDPGDEVIVPMPCFSEYPFYILNHSGRMVPVETDQDFALDVDAISRAVTSRTKGIILNSPNNPTGVLYRTADLERLARLIESLPHPVTVISDEPYRSIVFDGLEAPEICRIIPRTVIADSWSKAFAIAGERIGYLAISPALAEADVLINACTFTARILGYVNAPAVWQWVIAETAALRVDPGGYQKTRDLLCQALTGMGYQVTPPLGTFYVFPRTPISDDVAFIRILRDEGVLAVPGTGFGRSGYFRISLTVPDGTVERSLPGFERAIRDCRAQQH